MGREDLPTTPYHPQLSQLNREDPLLSPEQAQLARRVNAQMIYAVASIYVHAQYTVYYIGRYSAHPTQLYLECSLHVLRHLYGTRHIGLTLGGVGALQAGMHTPPPMGRALRLSL